MQPIVAFVLVTFIKKHHYRNPIVAFHKNVGIGLSIVAF